MDKDTSRTRLVAAARAANEGHRGSEVRPHLPAAGESPSPGQRGPGLTSRSPGSRAGSPRSRGASSPAAVSRDGPEGGTGGGHAAPPPPPPHRSRPPPQPRTRLPGAQPAGPCGEGGGEGGREGDRAGGGRAGPALRDKRRLLPGRSQPALTARHT